MGKSDIVVSSGVRHISDVLGGDLGREIARLHASLEASRELTTVNTTEFVARTFIHDAAHSDARLAERFVVEGNSTYASLVEVALAIKKDQISLMALQKKKQTPERGIKMLRLQTRIQANRQAFLATMARFRSMCEQHQSLLDRVGVEGFSVAMLEQEEISHWVRRLMTQTLNEWIQYTRMSQGQAEAWRKMGVDPLFVSLQVNQFMTAQVMGTVQTAPDLKLRNAFEDGMASLLAPVIKDHLDRQGQRLGGAGHA